MRRVNYTIILDGFLIVRSVSAAIIISKIKFHNVMFDKLIKQLMHLKHALGTHAFNHSY